VEQKLNNNIFIDSHAHLNLLSEKIDITLTRCRKENVKYILNVGFDVQSSEFSATITKNYTDVLGSIGIHPHYVDSANVSELECFFKKYLDNLDNSGVVALGEIGLDFMKSKSPKDKQFEIFEYQLNIAESKNLPVIIHNRLSDKEILEIMDNFPSLRGVFHCFSSDRKFAEKVLDRGFYISFAGNITFPKSNDLREVLKWIPLESILLETDAPYLSPQALRGKENHPVNVKLIYDLVASLKNISLEESALKLYTNFSNLFLKKKGSTHNG